MSDFEILLEIFSQRPDFVHNTCNYRIELNNGMARPGKILTILSDDYYYYIDYIFDENEKLKGTKIYISYFSKENKNAD